MTGYESIGHNIIIVDKYFKLYLKNCLRDLDINGTEAMVIMMIYEAECRTHDDMVNQLHYDKGAMTRTMRALEEKGYVVKMENPRDSRSHLFEPTSKAEETKDVILGIFAKWGQMITNGIEDIDLIKSTIKKMTENAAKAVEEEQKK